MNRARILAGRSFFPVSVAGFIAAKSRKSGCRRSASVSPLSVNVKLPLESSKSPQRRSSVSPEAKFISSKRTHLPVRIASTKAPSVKAKANPDSLATRCFSNLSAATRKFAHAEGVERPLTRLPEEVPEPTDNSCILFCPILAARRKHWDKRFHCPFSYAEDT